MPDTTAPDRLGISALRIKLAEHVIAVATTHQPIVITNRGKPIAALVPLTALEQNQKTGDPK